MARKKSVIKHKHECKKNRVSNRVISKFLTHWLREIFGFLLVSIYSTCKENALPNR